MQNSPNIDRMFQKAQHEVGDNIFMLLWFFTFIQAALILWELINLVPSLSMLLGGYANPAIHATEMTTYAYVVLQLAYMGKKEFLRWTKGMPSSVSLSSPGNLSSDETAKRMMRGDVAVLFWGVLMALGVCLQALTVISVLPQELMRTFIPVIGIYAFASASKTIRQVQDKQPVLRPKDTALPAPAPRQEESPEDRLDREIIQVLRKNVSAGMKELCETTHCPLSTMKLHMKNLVDAGIVEKQGTARSTVYSIKKK